MQHLPARRLLYATRPRPPGAHPHRPGRVSGDISGTELAAAPPAAGSGGVRHRRRGPVWMAAGAAGLVGVAALVGVAELPWEWSFIDDTGVLAILHGQQDLHGTVGGVWSAARVAYDLDTTWGLFRPAWWLYAGAFYLLPAGPAHAVRLLMLALALAGPLALVTRAASRRAAIGWAGAAL